VEGVFKNEEEAIRDIAKRKLNAKGDLGEAIGSHSYSAGIVNDKRIIKNINYFLFKVKNPSELKISPKLEGLSDIKFFALDELKNIDTYEDVTPLFKNVIKIFNI